MSYLTIRDFGKFEFEEKKSRFIGEILRVESDNEAKECLNRIKSENKEARHNVSAYIIGEKNEIQRYSDDGEPQGTGGIPILEVIKRNNLTDVLVVVTRYFGGILLGTGGLARAYSRGAAEAIKQAEIVEKVHGCAVNFTLDYDLLGKVQYYCEQNKLAMENMIYTDIVQFTILTEVNKSDALISSISNITSAKSNWKISDETVYLKSNDKFYKAHSIK